MIKASPVELRKTLLCAQTFARAGIDFVCIPIISSDNKIELNNQANKAMEVLIDLAESLEDESQHTRP